MWPRQLVPLAPRLRLLRAFFAPAAASVAALLLSVGCGAASSSPARDPSAAGAAASEASAAPSATLQAPEGPPALTANEKKEMAGSCSPIEEQLYEALKAAKRTVGERWTEEPNAAKLDEQALAAGLKLLAEPGVLSPAEHKRCVELFTKNARHELFAFEPAEEQARASLHSCARSVDRTYGSQKMSIDVSATPGSGAAAGPRFCYDAGPVPESLTELPYQSTPEDWDTEEWRCLQFGLRTEQRFQIEYGTDETAAQWYECIARYLPRQGGPAVELTRRGKVGEDGRLMHSKNVKRKLIPRP